MLGSTVFREVSPFVMVNFAIAVFWSTRSGVRSVFCFHGAVGAWTFGGLFGCGHSGGVCCRTRVIARRSVGSVRVQGAFCRDNGPGRLSGFRCWALF